MVYCHKCGTQLSEQFTFCNKCGEKTRQTIQKEAKTESPLQHHVHPVLFITLILCILSIITIIAIEVIFSPLKQQEMKEVSQEKETYKFLPQQKVQKRESTIPQNTIKHIPKSPIIEKKEMPPKIKKRTVSEPPPTIPKEIPPLIRKETLPVYDVTESEQLIHTTEEQPITAQRIQNILQQIQGIEKLPENTKIVLYVDQYGKSYTIGAEGTVWEGVAKDYDFRIMIDKKYITQLEKDPCGTLRKIKKSGGWTILDTNIGRLKTLWKYGGLWGTCGIYK